MAIVIRGKTRCPLCQRVLLDSDDVVVFPPFVVNRQSPLLVFHDAAVHRSCMESHRFGQLVLQLAQQIPERGRPGWHRCAACNEEILDPDDYFATGLLTENPAHPLHPFNFLELHRSHFPEWDRSEEFRRLVDAFQSSEEWEGPRVVFDPLPEWRR